MSLLDTDLCAGRKWTRVGDAYQVTKKPPGLDVSSMKTISFAAMEAIPHGGAYQPTFERKALVEIKSGTYFERGDVLVAKITPSFENGKQALVLDLPQPFGYATTEIIPLHRRNQNHDPRLLFFYLLHPDVRHHLAERMEGSTGRQRVPENVLLDLSMPELEHADQRVIANALETVQGARAAELTAEATAQNLKRATMAALFTQGMRKEAQKQTEIGALPESWLIEPLGAHYSVVSGGTPSRSNPSFWQDGTIPWVKTSEVAYCVINETDERITKAGLDGSAAKLLPPGTLLMAMYGQGVTRGKVAILGIEAACNQACAAMAPSDNAIDTRYLYHFLAYRYEAIRQLAHGGHQQNLNLDIVRDLPVAFSGEGTEQGEIVAMLDAIDRQIALHRRKRGVIEELFQSLLHKLMTGEISANDLDLSILARIEDSAAVMA